MVSEHNYCILRKGSSAKCEIMCYVNKVVLGLQYKILNHYTCKCTDCQKVTETKDGPVNFHRVTFLKL
jgi:hypothetical protein